MSRTSGTSVTLTILADLAQGIGSASALELFWTGLALVGVVLYAYGWWDIQQDREALISQKRDSDLRDLVRSDLETAVIGFVIMLIFFGAGLWACLVPSLPQSPPPSLVPQVVLFRIAIPIAFLLAEVLLVLKKALLLHRRHQQNVNLRRWRRPDASGEGGRSGDSRRRK